MSKEWTLCTSSCGNLASDLHEYVPQSVAPVALLRTHHIVFASRKSLEQFCSRHLCRVSDGGGLLWTYN